MCSVNCCVLNWSLSSSLDMAASFTARKMSLPIPQFLAIACTRGSREDFSWSIEIWNCACSAD